MIDLRVSKGGAATGRLLGQLLTAQGVRIGAQGANAVVSYGMPVQTNLPCINANAGRLNKFEELSRLKERVVCVPNFSRDGRGLTFPILGRKFKHSKARDIVPILQNDKEFLWRQEGGACDYFVEYVPRQREYRVWSYRRRPIAVYEKRMKYPEKYRVGKDSGIGWNWDHGFAFEFYHDAPQPIKDIGCEAVAAMDLDFGAVDIIESTNQKMVVLEVNSAPGVQDVRHGIKILAEKIARWEKLGYPRRNGDKKDAE